MKAYTKIDGNLGKKPAAEASKPDDTSYSF
jgi:hypothetical protein